MASSASTSVPAATEQAAIIPGGRSDQGSGPSGQARHRRAAHCPPIEHGFSVNLDLLRFDGLLWADPLAADGLTRWGSSCNRAPLVGLRDAGRIDSPDRSLALAHNHSESSGTCTTTSLARVQARPSCSRAVCSIRAFEQRAWISLMAAASDFASGIPPRSPRRSS